MNFPYGAPVLPSKLNALRERIAKLGINLSKIDEKFVRGGGKGGQKINKTSNAVMLFYDGIVVKVQRERQRELNRFLALRLLLEKIEQKLHG